MAPSTKGAGSVLVLLLLCKVLRNGLIPKIYNSTLSSCKPLGKSCLSNFLILERGRSVKILFKKELDYKIGLFKGTFNIDFHKI